MFGAILDAAMSIPNNMMMEEDRNQRQMWQGDRDIDMFQRSAVFNSAQAVAQRDWAERMSNTQHQRGVQDLRAAGLNPILSARQGGNASAGGSTASAGGSASSAGGMPGSVRSNFVQAELNSAQSELIKAQETVADQTKWNVSADTEKKKQETNLLMEQQDTQKEITKRIRHEAEIASNTAKGSSLEGEIDTTTYGKIMRYIDRSVRSITGAGSAYGRFKSE